MQVKNLSIKEIDKMTEQVLVNTFGDIDSIAFPIDLNKVVDLYGLTIKQGTFDEPDLQGAFDRNDKSIYLSGEDDFPNKNFTLAHEIGHYKLHEEVKTDIFTMHQLNNIMDRKGKDKLEDQADSFASSLLMPKKVFTKFWKLTRSVPTLVAIFGVPSVAVRLRMNDLNLK
jgi:Zn-dependent peptidase ImmA (M78 family)